MMTQDGQGPLDFTQFKSQFSGEFKEQFLLEAQDHLDHVENQLLPTLEKEPGDREALHQIFRAFHSIKGAAGIVSTTLPEDSGSLGILRELSQVTHSFETLLSLVRDRGLVFTPFLDLSYQVVDYLKGSLEYIALEKSLEGLPTKAILKAIASIVPVDEDSGVPQGAPGAPSQVQQSLGVASLRVSPAKIDWILALVEELMVNKNSFSYLAKKIDRDYRLPQLAREVKELDFTISRLTQQLHGGVLALRMVEIGTVFQRMHRILRDITVETEKKVQLVLLGEGTEIDKTIVELLSDPLIHMIRNAVDHGLESPAERVKKGKEGVGTIWLRAFNKQKSIIIEVEDDGQGIDPEKIKAKALEKGIINEDEEASLSSQELLNLIFYPGFSTASKVTKVSGRGVGMDVVKTNITKLKGSVTVESTINGGTKISLALPLTLAVSRGLLVEVAGEQYMFPLESILEVVKISPSKLHYSQGQYFLHWREEIIPCQWLARLFKMGVGYEKQDAQDLNHPGEGILTLLVIGSGFNKLGLIVNGILSEQEFVIKPLDSQLALMPGLAGSTLLSQGQVVLVLNPSEILTMSTG